MDKLSYAIGMSIGSQLVQAGITKINKDDFAQAVADMIAGEKPKLGMEEANEALQKATAGDPADNEAAKAAGEAFLKENATKDGVETTASGLQHTMLTEGSGKSPKATDKVTCHYEGRLIDGTVFDSSYKRGEPATFPLNGVIAGWTEGLQLMKEGGKHRFFIPYALGYGSRGAGRSIPPYSTLIFDVELIEVS